EHVAPGALAGMRLAGHEQHAQIFAYAFDRKHDAVVYGGNLAGRGLRLDLHDVRTSVVDLDRDFHLLSDAHVLNRREGFALASDGELDRGRIARGGLGDLELDWLLAADEPKARRAQHFKLAVELAGLASDERMHWRIEPERRGIARYVMHVAVGQHDDAGKPVRRHVDQALGEIREQHGAVAVAIGSGGGGMNPADVEIGKQLESVFKLLAHGFRVLIATGNALALGI